MATEILERIDHDEVEIIDREDDYFDLNLESRVHHGLVKDLLTDIIATQKAYFKHITEKVEALERKINYIWQQG